jgi:hypothetical protein
MLTARLDQRVLVRPVLKGCPESCDEPFTVSALPGHRRLGIAACFAGNNPVRLDVAISPALPITTKGMVPILGSSTCRVCKVSMSV